jgi:hypothetical protein
MIFSLGVVVSIMGVLPDTMNVVSIMNMLVQQYERWRSVI